MSAPDRWRVVHPITHLGVGGASENTVTICRYAASCRFDSSILCGLPPSREQSLLGQAEQYGLRIHFTPYLQREIHPARDLRAYTQMAAWLRRHPCDIVHTHTSKAGILGRLAAHRTGVRTILHTAHGWGHHNRMSAAKRSLYIALERAAARVSHKIIAVSQATIDRGLADRIGQSEQYTLIHSGIDIARYRDVTVDVGGLRTSLGIPKNAPVVGTVSRLTPQKAPEDFLQVAARVHARCPEVRFVFVGGGSGQAEFEAGIRSRGLQEVVLSVGYRHDIPEMLRVFDVFLLTSLWEGLPRVCAQAMCAGLPIVATCVDGAPEAVSDGETGFLASPRDCEALGQHVLHLLGDGDLRARMGRLGLDRVYPAFCDRNMVRRIEAVYEECLAQTEGR